MRCRLLFAFGALALSNSPAADSVYRDVDPARLSAGLYSALEDAGTLGVRPAPARARASYPDAGKGRAPAVLDARVGPNLRLGDDPDPLPATQRAQVEPHLVRSAANPALLLATFQEGRFFDAGGIACGYAVSRDGGLTWHRSLTPGLTQATGGRFNRATDPVAGAGPQGDLYLQALTSVQGAFSLAAIVVSRSTDAGATWSTPVVVFESTTGTIGPDKNWLAVNDYAGAPNSGRLVSTWTNFLRNATGTAIASPLVASVSDDRGLTWSAPLEITPPSSSNQGSQPVFLPDGSLAVIYISFLDPNNVARFGIHCKRSLDGGRTFPGLASTVVSAVVGWDDPQLRDGVFLPSAAVARQTGDLFVTYTAIQNGTPRIMLTRSTDLGASWSAPVVVSDQPAGISVMTPAVAATPDGRGVAVVFTDKRHAPGGRDFVDHYAALSFDGGATWQPNIRLSDVSSDISFGPATSRGVMLGDYLSVTAPVVEGQPFVTAWCDTRTGDADPFVASFLSAPEPAYGAWAAVHRLTDNHLDDADGDGTPNYLEFIAGTNPRTADVGLDLVTRPVSANTIEVAWTERAAAVKQFPAVGVSTTPLRAFTEGGFSLAGTIPGTALDNDYLGVPAGAGRIWRTAQFGLSEPASVFARSYRFSAGPPARASAAAVTVHGDGRLVNLSTRGRAGSGDQQLIVGFVLDGDKTILLRAAGPALTAFGVPGALADPVLTLSAPTDLARTNDNWQQGGDATSGLFTHVGAFPFATNSLDAALALPLGAQSYTALVSGANNGTGVTLVEAYDADPVAGAAVRPRLVNLSTRGAAGGGDDALIAGFVISGTQPRRVLLRGLGPALAQFGLTSALPDPVLTLHRAGVEIARNDDWEISRSPAAVAATAQLAGAFALPGGSRDAALLLSLSPGAYTATVSSADGSSGLALVEVYDAN